MSKEKATKIHLTEIEVITGEEGERNVLQVSLLSMNETCLTIKLILLSMLVCFLQMLLE